MHVTAAPRRLAAALPPLRAALLALSVLAAPAARAGLFDDEEARKAILDLRARVAAIDEQNKARVAELAQQIAAANAASNAQLLEQISTLKRSLLDLNNQLEALRQDNARLRGTQEQLAKDVADAQRRQRDVGSALEERLRKLEPQKVTADGREFVVEPEEKRAYEEALAVLRTGDFDKASSALGGFVRRYGHSGYIDSARFWLGNALYGKRDYKEAIATFRALVSSSPDHPRSPEALLAIANCQAEMKDVRTARRTIDELMKAYPASEAAAAGKERLATLKG